jgi:hypothetical protein
MMTHRNGRQFTFLIEQWRNALRGATGLIALLCVAGPVLAGDGSPQIYRAWMTEVGPEQAKMICDAVSGQAVRYKDQFDRGLRADELHDQLAQSEIPTGPMKDYFTLLVKIYGTLIDNVHYNLSRGLKSSTNEQVAASYSNWCTGTYFQLTGKEAAYEPEAPQTQKLDACHRNLEIVRAIEAAKDRGETEDSAYGYAMTSDARGVQAARDAQQLVADVYSGRVTSEGLKCPTQSAYDGWY